MKQLVIYYSLSGKTKQFAEQFATENNADICEIIPKKKIGKFKAFFMVPKAITGKGVPIEPLAVGNLVNYQIFHIFSPIWASSIAPPVNSAITLLPKNADITLNFTSAGGESDKKSIEKRLTDLGFKIKKYTDICSKNSTK